MGPMNGHATKAGFGFDRPKQIAFDANPPREGPELFILRLKGDQTRTFTIFSAMLCGMWTHWASKKSEPHYLNERDCPGCQARRPKRWKGFLHSFCHEMSQEVLLELTPHSAKSLLNQLGKDVPLRGNRIQVKRTKGDNGRLLISVLTAVAKPEDLPAEKDPKISILKLWGFDDETLDKAFNGNPQEGDASDFN